MASDGTHSSLISPRERGATGIGWPAEDKQRPAQNKWPECDCKGLSTVKTRGFWGLFDAQFLHRVAWSISVLLRMKAGKTKSRCLRDFFQNNYSRPYASSGGRFYMQTMVFASIWSTSRIIDVNAEKDLASALVMLLMIKKFLVHGFPTAQEIGHPEIRTSFKVWSSKKQRSRWITSKRSQMGEKFRKFGLEKVFGFMPRCFLGYLTSKDLDISSRGLFKISP